MAEAAKVEPITVPEDSEGKPKDVLEPYSKHVKPLRQQVEQTPSAAMNTLIAYLLVKVIDELVGLRFALRRK